jgi:translation initiation factor 5A
MSDNEEIMESFQSSVSGASLVFPLQCSALRKGGFVVLKGKPCKVVDMSTSKTGKHGSAKVNLVGIDIFTGKKYEEFAPSTSNMEVPFVTRNEYPLLNVDDGYLSMMLSSGDTKDDIKLPEGELGEQIKAAFDEGRDLLVAVIGAMGEEHAMSFKDAPK